LWLSGLLLKPLFLKEIFMKKYTTARQMNHGSKNFSNNKNQFMKNTGNFSAKGSKQLPKNVTFSATSKRHA